MRSPSPGPKGWQKPRIRNVPPAAHSLADEALDLATVAGKMPIPWQAAAVTDFMACKADGTWAASEVALLCARQNGKNGVVEMMELGWLTMEPGVRILHTAQEIPAVLEAMNKLEALFDGHPELRAMIPRNGIRKRGGEEGITLRNGSRILFRTRTDSTARTFSFDRVVIDEAMYYTAAQENSIRATLTTGRNVQRVYVGSAPDWRTMPNSEIWASVIQRGRRGSPNLAYVEHSAPEDADPGDPRSWLMANPSIGYLTTEDYFRGEWDSMKDRNPDGFKVERLSIPVFPPSDEDEEELRPISEDAWNRGIVAEDFSPPDSAPAALGCSQDWAGTGFAAAAATALPDGSVYVELGRLAEPNTAADTEFVSSAVELQDPVAVVLDDRSATAVLEPRLIKAGIEPVKTSTAQIAAAAQLVKALADEGLLMHNGDELLTEAVLAARPRDIGRTGMWGFAWDTPVNQAPVIAMALAVWGVLNKAPKVQAPPPAVGHVSTASAGAAVATPSVRSMTSDLMEVAW